MEARQDLGACAAVSWRPGKPINYPELDCIIHLRQFSLFFDSALVKGIHCIAPQSSPALEGTGTCISDTYGS